MGVRARIEAAYNPQEPPSIAASTGDAVTPRLTPSDYLAARSRRRRAAMRIFAQLTAVAVGSSSVMWSMPANASPNEAEIHQAITSRMASSGEGATSFDFDVAGSRTPQAPLPHADATVGIRISSLSPSVLSLDRGLRIGGIVGDAGAGATVRVHLSRSPLSSRSALDALTTSTSAAADAAKAGRLLASATVAAGRGSWNLIIDRSALDLTATTRAGVYAITASVWRGNEVIGATATAAPFITADSNLEPSRIVMLWPVTSMPIRDFNGGISNTRLSATLGKTGVLRALIQAGGTEGLSWLIDPALVLTMKTAAAATPRGATEVSSGSKQAAAAWLRGLGRVARTARLAALPASLPDPAALTTTNFRSDYTRAQRTAVSRVRYAAKPRYQVLQTVAIPCLRGASCVSSSVLAHLGDRDGARASVVVLPDSAASTSSRSFSGGGVQRLPGHTSTALLYTDKNLDNAIAGKTGITSAAALRQRILSDLALISFERPGRPRTVVAIAPIGVESSHAARGITAAAAALSLATDAGLITPITLNKVAGLGNDGITRTFRSTTSVPLTAKQQIRAAAGARKDALRAALLPAARADRLMWRKNADDMFLAASSIIWRTHTTAQSQFVEQLRADALAMRSGVEVLSASRVWLGSRRGTIPFTLHNTLAVPVTVYPQLRADAPSRIEFTNPPSAVTLQPGERAGMPIDVTLLGGTAVKVSVEVRDAKGRLVNVPRPTQVGTSAYARFSLYIVVAAFVALVFLMANNIRRRIRRRRSGSTEDDPNAIVDVTDDAGNEGGDTSVDTQAESGPEGLRR